MANHRTPQKSKRSYLRLSVRFVVGLMAVCIAAGIFIGSKIRKPSDFAQATDGKSPSDSTETTPNTSAALSNIDKTQWNLILVNRWNPLPENYTPTLTYLKNGQAIDERAYPDLQEMMDDCRAEGFNPVICSSYRSMEIQKELFDNKVDEYLALGYSQEKAEQAAAKLVAVPGTSEHQLGLALDIVDIANQILDENQENTDVQKWLMQNSWKYGFILRYPTDKGDITGISYEPWHYRYVGKQAASEIYAAGVCLEEYLDS